jgi:hypothetical protein
MDELEITFDHSYMYVNREKFFPIIQEQVSDFHSLESTNGVLLTVRKIEEEINWDALYAKAEEAVAQGKWIIWELDFFRIEQPVFIQDSASFFSLTIEIEEFLAKLWTHFKEKSLGVVLFRGDVDFSKYFIWTEQHEQYFLERKEEYPLLSAGGESENFLRALFAADIFSGYLHRLSSVLPETLLSFCLLDVSAVESNAQLSFILSKEKFQHILFALKKAKISLGHLNWEEGACFGGWIGQGAPYFSTVPEVVTGVCLPLPEVLSSEILALLDETFLKLSRFDIPFRVVEEDLLHECWDGIDDLIVLSSALSLQGMRKLHGFLAAGGRVVSIGPSIGLSNEISLSDFTKHLQEAEVLF